MSACVFCGEPIEPDQPSVARPPMAAHAACADAALADDAHWDAIAEREGEAEPGTADRRGRAGCLALAVAAGLAIAALSRR